MEPARRAEPAGVSRPKAALVGAVLLIAGSLLGGCRAADIGAADAGPQPRHSTTESLTPSGVPRPDARLTPGSVFPAATRSVICVAGYTARVRDVTESERHTVFAAYGIPYATHGEYELDHLISLELGGDNSVANLWPEPYASRAGARVKDLVENELHNMVCERQMALATAQHLIATDWWRAYQRYGGTSHVVEAGSVPPGAVAGATASPAQTRTASGVLSCTASMSDPHPADYGSTDVIVRTAPGATVETTVHYESTDTGHRGTAGPSGVADIEYRISRATYGSRVAVDVEVTLDGRSASCSTSFTPEG